MKVTTVLLATIVQAMALPCAVASDAPPIVVTTSPQLGSVFSIPSPSHFEMIAAAQLSPSCRVKYAGVVFTVAVNRDGHIIYVGTSDPAFKTPEGFTVASPLSVLLASGIAQPVRESGWAYHTALPSGWHAAFTSGHGSTESPLHPDSYVQWFFKRQ